MTGLPYRYRASTLDEAKAVLKQVGQNPPIAADQFWYDHDGDKIMVVDPPETESPFAAVVIFEFRRAVTLGYAKRDFERFVYAPLILERI